MWCWFWLLFSSCDQPNFTSSTFLLHWEYCTFLYKVTLRKLIYILGIRLCFNIFLNCTTHREGIIDMWDLMMSLCHHFGSWKFGGEGKGRGKSCKRVARQNAPFVARGEFNREQLNFQEIQTTSNAEPLGGLRTWAQDLSGEMSLGEEALPLSFALLFCRGWSHLLRDSRRTKME